MKKIFIIFLCVSIVVTGSISAFAVDNDVNLYDNNLVSEEISNTDNVDLNGEEYKLISLLRENGNISTDNLVAQKVNINSVKKYIASIDNVNLSESDVYYIENKKGNIVEKSILADMAVAASGNSGENVINGSSARVVASCVIGYEYMSKNTVEYIKGTYYGGKVVSQPNSSVISSIKGAYYEVGPYITVSGGSGISTDYTTSANFDVSKHTTLQKKTVSRDRYFNSEASAAAVRAKYSVSGTVNGNKFSFDVIANAF